MPATPKRATRQTPKRKASPTKRKASPAKRKASSRPRTLAKSTARGGASATARARHERNRRALDRIKKTLDVTQKEMTAIRGSLETGGRDLRKDVVKLLRDARREVEKMNKAVLRDVERVQKDLATAAKASRQKAPARKPRRRPTARGGRSRAA